MRAFAARFVIAAVVVTLLMTGAVYAANNKVTAALGTITGCAVQGSDGACARSSSSAPTRVS